LIIAIIIFALISGTPDLNTLSLLAIAILPISVLVGAWILSYSIVKKSWKFFLYGECIILLIIIFWLIIVG
jgi:ABC-type transport system involved in multi-copper enzyme maturation permease subunit